MAFLPEPEQISAQIGDHVQSAHELMRAFAGHMRIRQAHHTGVQKSHQQRQQRIGRIKTRQSATQRFNVVRQTPFWK